jgi:thymidylate synthase
MLLVNDIRKILYKHLYTEEFVTDKSGVKTIEIVNASFLADEEAIFGTVNQEYVERELEWYKSMSLNVNDIPGGPPAIWKMVANPNGLINSNYGWCIYSQQNGNQFDNVVNELIKNPLSRRATMIYNRPTMHEDYNKGGMSDFMCTNAVQYLIRDNKVNALVYMRSNDAIFGYKNDYAWQKHVLDEVTRELKNEWLNDLQVGKIYWNVASLHVYERHFELVTDGIYDSY